MNPFELPIHPAVVHFPIAMLISSWVCLVLRYGDGHRRWRHLGRTFETIGVVSLPVAIAAGFIDLRGIQPLTATRWDQPLIWHVLAAFAGSVLFGVHALADRRWAGIDGLPIAVDLGLSTAAAWFIVLAGMLAGEMVYAS